MCRKDNNKYLKILEEDTIKIGRLKKKYEIRSAEGRENFLNLNTAA